MENENINIFVEEMHKLNIPVKNEDGSYRSLYDILNDIHKYFNNDN